MKWVVTFAVNRESKGNGSQHGGKDVCTCSCCGDILMTDLELCLQTSTEAKIDINPNILRNIVEVMEEGILAKIWWKKRALRSAEDIKYENEKLMPSKGAILNVTKVNLQLTSDTKTILRDWSSSTGGGVGRQNLFQWRRFFVDPPLNKGWKSQWPTPLHLAESGTTPPPCDCGKKH